MFRQYYFQYIFFLCLIPLTASATLRLTQAQNFRTLLGMDRYDRFHMDHTKVAIIDNGFTGVGDGNKFPKEESAYEEIITPSITLVKLFKKAFVEQFKLGDPEQHVSATDTEHGRYLMTIFREMIGWDKERAPHLYLLNGSGLTNVRRSVRYAIDNKVQVILYAQELERFGNFDGKGFFNDIINQATQAGIIWVNSAGNHAGRVGNYTVGQVQERGGLKIKSHLDELPAQIMVSWEASHETESSGSDKNLDVILVNEAGKEIAKSELIQVKTKPDEDKKETAFPRENIKTTLPDKGNYTIKLVDKSGNFAKNDWVRVVVVRSQMKLGPPDHNKEIDPLEFLDATVGQETMVGPDNPNVIAVAEANEMSSKGPTRDGRTKPDVVMPLFASAMSNNKEFSESSNASAYFFAAATAMKAAHSGLTKDRILELYKEMGEGYSMKVVDRAEVTKHFDVVIEKLEKKMKEPIVIFTKEADQHHYLIGIKQDPRTLGLEYCERTNSGTSNLFIGRSAATGGVCLLEKEFTKGRSEFLEIRQMRDQSVTFTRKDENPASKWNGSTLWLTPMPEDLI